MWLINSFCIAKLRMVKAVCSYGIAVNLWRMNVEITAPAKPVWMVMWLVFSNFFAAIRHVCLCLLLAESELTRTCPHLHPRSMYHSWPRIYGPQGVETKGMERDDMVGLCKTSLDPFCSVCSTVQSVASWRYLTGLSEICFTYSFRVSWWVHSHLSLEGHPQPTQLAEPLPSPAGLGYEAGNTVGSYSKVYCSKGYSIKMYYYLAQY